MQLQRGFGGFKTADDAGANRAELVGFGLQSDSLVGRRGGGDRQFVHAVGELLEQTALIVRQGQHFYHPNLVSKGRGRGGSPAALGFYDGSVATWQRPLSQCSIALGA